MMNLDSHILWIIAIVAIIAAYLCYRWFASVKSARSRSHFILDTLQAAAQQKTPFDLKFQSAGHSSGVSAYLVPPVGRKLILQTHARSGEGWVRTICEAYFRVGHEDNAAFYVFDAPVLEVGPGEGEGVRVTLEFPERLRVEKKRHFLRVQPNQKDILMISVWPSTPGVRLPRSTSDLSKAAASWKSGEGQRSIRIDNVSGSGIALSLSQEIVDGNHDFNLALGRQILCLLIFRPGGQNTEPIIFWCANEIRNVRKSDNSVILGLEFTNTAVQEHGSPEIHWTHSSPWRGVKPIIQWVQRIDKAQN